MCSRNGTPILTFSWPVPSRCTAAAIWVSRVFRSTRALRSDMLHSTNLWIIRDYWATTANSRPPIISRAGMPWQSRTPFQYCGNPCLLFWLHSGRCEVALKVGDIGVQQGAELMLHHRADSQLQKPRQRQLQSGFGTELQGGFAIAGQQLPKPGHLAIAHAFYRLPGDQPFFLIGMITTGIHGLQGVLIQSHLFHFPAIAVVSQIG